jgi:hypothetical protein
MFGEDTVQARENGRQLAAKRHQIDGEIIRMM